MRSTENNQVSSTPARSQFTSSFLQDISNFKTPKCISKSVNNHAFGPSPSSRYFTASWKTPASSARPRIPNSARIKLKAFELEQRSPSCRKEQFKKEQSLKSLTQSLTTWLNFLLSNPTSCGCSMREEKCGESVNPVGLGKRESDRPAGWRCPKRQKGREKLVLPEINKINDTYSFLRRSIEDICSLDDLKERMRSYINLDACEEIFRALANVFKNIDNGRLKMRQHCPIVSDLGMKEKAKSVLLSYNPSWLRIGLHIIFGGDSILPNGNENSDAEVSFLKILLEKIFFSHAGLAKDYAYNKRVEGLYKPGYYENLGNVILKRFFILAVVLDQAKILSSLPLEYGIDGIDGGSPPLFKVRGNVKCSRQVINEFLTSEVMHGEGNLLSHLEMLGFHVSYEQNPIVEYEFYVNDLFTDLRDGVRLSRATQLLLNENFIMTKVAVPSDTRKNKIENCRNVLNYLKRANIPMHDDDEFPINEDNIVSGDKELTISLLWNMFVHLQLPLLINKSLLAEEVSKICEDVVVSPLASPSSSTLELLLSWIQIISAKYNYKVDCFSTLVDGRALWCILDFYFRREVHCPRSFKHSPGRGITESIMSSTEYTDAVYNFMLSQKLSTLLGNFPEVLQTSDILEYRSAPNYRCVIILLVFLSSQLIRNKATENLNFHKLLGCDCQDTDRCSRLHRSSIGHIVKREEINLNDAKDAYKRFKAVKEWWHSMAENVEPLRKEKNDEKNYSMVKEEEDRKSQEKAAITIQSYIRKFISRRHFLKIKKAALRLQILVKRWLFVRRKNIVEFEAAKLIQSHVRSFALRRQLNEMRKAVILLQMVARARRFARKRSHYKVLQVNETNHSKQYIRYAEYFAARNGFVRSKAATVMIQSHFKGYMLRKKFRNEKKAACLLQDAITAWLLLRNANKSCECDKPKVRRVFHMLHDRHHFVKVKLSVIHLQREIRIWIDKRRRKRTMNNAAVVIQKYFRIWKSTSHNMDAHVIEESQGFNSLDNMETCRSSEVELLRRSLSNFAATKIQTCYRAYRWRKNVFDQRIKMLQAQKIKLLHENSAVIVQSHVRRWIARKMIKNLISFQRQRRVQLEISRSSEIQQQEALSCFETNHITTITNGLEVLNTSLVVLPDKFTIENAAATTIQTFYRSRSGQKRLSRAIEEVSVIKLQRWWKRIYTLKLSTNSAVILQSYFKGWLCRKRMAKWKQSSIVIQSRWRAYTVRKTSNAQLLDLRLRIHNASQNIDDNMRIINKLIFALSELQNMKSTRGILHTCVILNTTTLHSQKCCEKLVDAGAIQSILKLLKSVSRSVPDQEILKLSLSTIRNLVRYPHLMNVLIDCPGSIETIILEFLRNKDEGYFIAADILKRICSFQKGVTSIRKFPHFLKRLHALAEDQCKKSVAEQKKLKGFALREKTERRVQVASELLSLIVR